MESKELTLKDVWKNAIIKTLKILGLVVATCFLLLSILIYGLPSVGKKVTGFLGFKNGERYCYQKLYLKSNSPADLYNLIIFEQQNQNNYNELQAINLLMNREDYSDFCEKLDSASIKACEDKKVVAYISSINMFLKNQKIICMFNLEDITCSNEVVNNLSSTDILDDTFSTYVNLVLSSSLNNNQKVAYLRQLMTTNTLNLLETRETQLKNKFTDVQDEALVNGKITEKFALKVTYKYILSNLYEACYHVYNMIGEDLGVSQKAEEYRALWEATANEYDEIVK